MQNETKLSQEKINSLISMFSQRDAGKTEGFINSNLNENQRRKINNILSDPQKLKEIMSSPQAQELMKKFNKSKPGENSNGSP